MKKLKFKNIGLGIAGAAVAIIGGIISDKKTANVIDCAVDKRFNDYVKDLEDNGSVEANEASEN